MSDEYTGGGGDAGGGGDSGYSGDSGSAPSSDGGAPERALSYNDAKSQVMRDCDDMDKFARLLKVDMNIEKEDPGKAKEERAKIARELYEDHQRLRAEADPVSFEHERMEAAETQHHNDVEEAELGATFRANARSFMESAPDFSQAVQVFNELPIENKTFNKLVRHSSLGPEIIYRIASNPDTQVLVDGITHLNSLDDKAAHYWFAKYETEIENLHRQRASETSRFSEPRARRQTSAPPPLKTPRGGAGAPVNEKTGPDDMGSFSKWLRKGLESRNKR